MSLASWTMSEMLVADRSLRPSRTRVRSLRTTSAARLICAAALPAISRMDWSFNVSACSNSADYVCIGTGCRKGLIDLVRDRDGQFAHAAQAGELGQRMLVHAQLRLRRRRSVPNTPATKPVTASTSMRA